MKKVNVMPAALGLPAKWHAKSQKRMMAFILP